MDTNSIKNILENNLNQQKELFTDIPVNAPGIIQFILTLQQAEQIQLGNSTIKLLDEDTLSVTIQLGDAIEMAGITAGSIKNAKVELTLKQTDDTSEIALQLDGTFEIPDWNKSFDVKGTLSDPESWVLEIEIDTSDLPGLNDLIDQVGTSDISDGINSLEIELPALTKVWFAYNFSTKSITTVGFQSNMQVGEIGFVATGIFAPDFTIFAGLEEGSQISIANILNALHIDVPSLPDINIATLNMSLHPSSKSISASASLEGNWNIGNVGNEEFVVEKVAVDFSKQSSDISFNLYGEAQFLESVFTIEAEFADEVELKATAADINLTRFADTILDGVDLPDEVPDVVFDSIELSMNPVAKTYSFSADSTEDWEIPIGLTGLKVEDLQLSLAHEKVTESEKFETSTRLFGKASIGSVHTSLEYNIPGDFVLKTQIDEIDFSPMIQDLCGPQAMMGISLPAPIATMKLQDVTISAEPQKKEFSVSGTSFLGSLEVIINKNEQGKWVFVTAFVPPQNWQFSSIDSSLQTLDDLDFDNSGLILSSARDRSVPVSIVQIPSGLVINEGLTFFASLDMSDLGVKDLMDVDSLTVSAVISRNPASIQLSASMGGSFQISENIAMGDLRFFLRPAPTVFELGIKGSVLAKLDKSDLEFVGSMAIRPIERSAAFAATMLGFWDEPFDIKGLSIGNLALEVGVGIVPPPAVAAPIVGMTGSISIGAFSGTAAVKFDTANPGKSMIAASFNRLYLNEVIQTFCDPNVYNQIPADIRDGVLNAGLEEVAVYVVPQPTTIGEFVYDQGFKFQGKLSIMDFDAEFFFLLSYNEGFAIKATMDPIIVENIFELKGSGNYPGPTLDVDLRIGESPGIVIAGAISVLGIKAETLVQISNVGFLFIIEGKIFDLFYASLHVRGGNLKNGGDFYIKAEMRNDLIGYLQENIRKAIQDAANEATQEIQEAIDDVNNAQKKVNQIQKDINNVRRTIEAERRRDAQKVKDAENAVNYAQKKVNQLQNEINSVRRTIQAERNRDIKRLRDAQRSVSDAQSKVNSIQSEINSSYRRINTLNSHIRSKKRWYDNSPWYKKTYRWAEYSAYAAAKGAEITGLYAKIGSLETAKVAANGVLEGAKQIVRGIELGAKTFPIEADPRMVGLVASKATATGILEAAEQTLKLARATIKAFPIEADPRMVGLYTAYGTATGALKAAEVFLTGTKGAVGGLADVGDFIVKYGLGGLFDVKAASFEGQLNVVQYASVNMALSLLVMNKPLDFALEFNFHNLPKTLKSLSEHMLQVIK